MLWLQRHLVAIIAVVAALASVGGVFVFARPAYQPAVTEHVVKMAGEDHYTAAEVTRGFAAHGIDLIRRSEQSGTIFFGERRPGLHRAAFTVTLYSPRATVGFGTSGPSPLYERRLGNLFVSYGDRDAAFAARVAAAVDSIAR